MTEKNNDKEKTNYINKNIEIISWEDYIKYRGYSKEDSTSQNKNQYSSCVIKWSK